MKIKLGEIQKAVLFQILKEKQAYQTEVAKLIQRENELVAFICESAGIQPVEGMTISEGHLVIPEIEPQEPVVEVKPKKTKSK